MRGGGQLELEEVGIKTVPGVLVVEGNKELLVVEEVAIEVNVPPRAVVANVDTEVSAIVVNVVVGS